MTTLVSWISYTDTGEDPHLPRAVYLISDSRITWGSARSRWEAGRKIYAAASEPHLFGFSGDVVLPALILGQIISAIDTGVLFGPSSESAARHKAVFKAVERGVACAIATPTLDFTIHHLLREKDWPETRFRAWSITYIAENKICTSAEIALPKTTDVIASYGTGSKSAKIHYDRWQKTESMGRSRAILSAFCDSIRSGDDALSGGPPQMAALYTRGSPIQIGMYIEERTFFNGLEVEATPSLQNAEWRDNIGQVVDPLTGKVPRKARRFARPNRISQK